MHTMFFISRTDCPAAIWSRPTAGWSRWYEFVASFPRMWICSNPPTLTVSSLQSVGGSMWGKLRRSSREDRGNANASLALGVELSRQLPHDHDFCGGNGVGPGHSAVATSAPGYVGPRGLRVGEAASEAEGRVHRRALSGCEQGFFLGGIGTKAELSFEVRGGRVLRNPPGVLQGGRISGLSIASTRHPVGCCSAEVSYDASVT